MCWELFRRNRRLSSQSERDRGQVDNALRRTARCLQVADALRYVLHVSQRTYELHAQRSLAAALIIRGRAQKQGANLTPEEKRVEDHSYHQQYDSAL